MWSDLIGAGRLVPSQPKAIKQVCLALLVSGPINFEENQGFRIREGDEGLCSALQWIDFF